MDFNFINKLDAALLAAVIILILLGLVTIFSTSYSTAGIDFLNFKKQLAFSIIGIGLLMAVGFFDYRALKNYTGVLYLFALFILAAVLFFGSQTRGMTGWFDFGFFKFQPVEFAKIIIIVILAKYLSRADISILRKIITSGIYMSAPVFLIMRQPDLGDSLTIIFIWFSMLAVSGIKRNHVAIILLLSLIVFAGSWSFTLKEYQKDRIINFINPQSDPLGSGYNVIQSMIAIGSGGIWGKGLGHGSQSQLNFLPEKHTDFIFAVVAEEMGFIGVLLVLTLFGIIFHRLFAIAVEAQDNFGKLLALGTLFMLVFHVVVNIGMNMGIMPVTGIPLPFISYGGSSLISFLIMMGIAQNVYAKGRGYKIEKEED